MHWRSTGLVEQSVLLPTLKPNISGDPEAAQGVDNHDDSHNHLNYGHYRRSKRRVSALNQKVLEFIGMEDNLIFLYAPGLGTCAVDFILSKD
ncbi:hypothetical protein AYI68_g7608 [Smittium mucronatum]|uniref:Uncharacterized protein n=1 Tax=Smittium mucronatum TaxID=133383 RepID=A0A1R0GN78_9FUNG|nr:hypothetical protein AYI68_g7608 [Smittium mucronatum]